MLERFEQLDYENSEPLTELDLAKIEHRKLVHSFLDAIENDDFDKIEKLLEKKLPDPNEHLRITIFNPSVSCLSECIWHLQKHQYVNDPINYVKYKELTMRLLSAPYFIKPDDNCLCYAIMNQQHDLINLFITRYRRELNCDENTLQYAISACNVKMVRYLLFKYRVPIDPELFEYIYDEKQSEDEFPIEERTKRNRIIRRLIKQALREDSN